MILVKLLSPKFNNNSSQNGAVVASGGAETNLASFLNCTFSGNTSSYAGTTFSGFASLPALTIRLLSVKWSCRRCRSASSASTRRTGAMPGRRNHRPTAPPSGLQPAGRHPPPADPDRHGMRHCAVPAAHQTDRRAKGPFRSGTSVGCVRLPRKGRAGHQGQGQAALAAGPQYPDGAAEKSRSGS